MQGARTSAPAVRSVIALACALAVIVGACGGTGSTGSDADAGASGCPSGQVFCAGCTGGGFCSAAGCPNIACPAPAGQDGSAGDAGAPGVDGGGVCPALAPTSCSDCSGAQFCVATACPTYACPVADSGTDSTSPDTDATSSGTDAPSAADGASADGPGSTTCTLDGGECPAGWGCMCWSHTGAIGTYTCTCHKQCTTAVGCPADHALCGCGTGPGAGYAGLCVSNCECSCG